MFLSLLISLFADVTVEAESGALSHLEVASTRAGYSGSGYLTNITANEATATWQVTAPAGLYELRVRYATPGGPKGYGISVNGSRYDGMLPDSGGAWQLTSLGLVELVEGVNTLKLERGWGYYELDRIDLSPAQPIPMPKPVPVQLSVGKAGAETQRLFENLAKLYGKATLLGGYGEAEERFVRDRTGQRPAVFAGDFMDYSPSRTERGADPKDHTERMVQAGKEGQIITMSWHWNAPTDLLDTKEGDKDLSWYKGFYTEATTFDIEAALADPSSHRYRLLLRDIDAIAQELKKFRSAGVPVLWRPLHEAEGKWFWWGAKGPEACKKLWRLLHDRLTSHHKLDNLIWVWNSIDPVWYPGDDVVDIVSVDAYPADRRDPMAGTFRKMLDQWDGRKMLALAEFPGTTDLERAWRFGVRWLYTVWWTGSLGPEGNDSAVLDSTFRSKHGMTLEEWGRLRG